VRDVLLANDDLDDPAGITQVDEDHAAVIAALGDPPRQRDLLSRLRGAQGPGLVRADHLGSALLSNKPAGTWPCHCYSPRAGPEAGCSPARNGLDARSAPMVVWGPWPESTTVSSGSGRQTRARLSRIVW